MEWCATCSGWGWCQHSGTAYPFTVTTSGTTTGGTGTYDRVWSQWQQTITVTGQTTVTASWYDGANSNTVRLTVLPPDVAVSVEEQARADEVLAERRAERLAAATRARALLDSLLSPAQRDELAQHEGITVVTPAGHRYRIICAGGYIGNVRLLGDNGERLAALCCHSSGSLSAYDHYAHQLLALMADEERFVGTANVHRSYRATRRRSQAPGGEYVYTDAA
jgi:hypothetical protein